MENNFFIMVDSGELCVIIDWSTLFRHSENNVPNGAIKVDRWLKCDIIDWSTAFWYHINCKKD